MRHAIIAVAAVVAGLTAVPAAAAPAAPAEDAATSITVTYADLDLTKPAGTEVLQSRIDRALDRVCEKPDMRDLKAARDFESCQTAGRDAAMQQLSLADPFTGIALASAF